MPLTYTVKCQDRRTLRVFTKSFTGFYHAYMFYNSIIHSKKLQLLSTNFNPYAG